METEVETKQYCVTVNLWVWADDEAHAEKTVEGELDFLHRLDNPVSGFCVIKAVEDKEA